MQRACDSRKHRIYKLQAPIKMNNFMQRKYITIIFGISALFLSVLILLQIFLEEYLDSPIIYRPLISHSVSVPLEDVNVPVIVWWTPFTGEIASFRICGNVECFFTEDRRFIHHPLIKVIVFYGSKFEVLDLPLPRNSAVIDWALFHEESPKNTPVLSHESALNLFNFTATFSRWSSFPLTLQYLQDLETLVSHKYLVQLKEKNALLHDLAPILYIHSDCNTPLERDAYVVELMKHIAVDSYGSCLQNQKLPSNLADPLKSLDSEEFFHFVARYKFTLAFENSVCDDYITEKLWRPLIVGSIPVYLGSPSVHDWLPNLKSAIIVSDYKSPKALAEFLMTVNNNDKVYESFLEHKLNDIDKRISNVKLIAALQKRQWGLGDDFEKGNMVEHFECFICQKSTRQNIQKFVANISHYNCPSPVSPLTHKRNESNWWLDQWKMGHCEAEVLKKFIYENKDYTQEQFYEEVKKLILKDEC